MGSTVGDELNGGHPLREVLLVLEEQSRIATELNGSLARTKLALDGNKLLLQKLHDRMLADIDEQKKTRLAVEKIASVQQSIDGNIASFLPEITTRIKGHTDVLSAHTVRIGNLEQLTVGTHEQIDDVHDGVREASGAIKVLAASRGEGEKDKGGFLRALHALPESIRAFKELPPLSQFFLALIVIALVVAVALHFTPAPK